MIMCQRCQKRPAEIQTSQNIGGRIVYAPVCRECFDEIQKSAQTASFVEKFGKDLTLMAQEGKLDPVIGRAEEISRIIHILSRRTKNNPVLIGDPGVGKTAVVEGLAQKIVEGSVPEPLKGKRVVTIDMASMIAGTSHRGQFEERLKNVLDEVIGAQGQIIMFIDEIHTIVGAGSAEGAMDAANILKPALSKGEIQLIGATTIDEYRRRIEKDKALERRFQTILINEPTISQTKEIIYGLKEKYEKFHQVAITNDAVTASVELSDRYISDRFLPDKAIDLIDEACAMVRIAQVKEPENLKEVEKEINELREAVKNNPDGSLKEKLIQLESVKKELLEIWTKTKLEDIPEVSKNDVAKIISRATGIPLEDLSEEERERLAHLENKLHERMVGQEEAVKAVSESVRRARAGLKNPQRPIGTFMFMGPTGVGKTELAKALTQVLYGSDELLVRLDMTEYMEKHTVSRMIGSPPGYVGFEDAGQLTEIVRRKPFSVVLFDEIEKAHPEVFNILLQIMDDGRLTDSHGRTVDFKNTILIMTSNLGSQTVRMPSIGFGGDLGKKLVGYEEMKEKILSELKTSFSPEFLNRVDEVLVFKPLSGEDIKAIVSKELKKTALLLDNQGINVIFSESCLSYLSQNGFSEEYGARLLKRLIQKTVENPLSDMIIRGEAKGGDTVEVFLVKGQIKVKVLEKALV
ncbi:ATP-dependent Clp protease ATP-binding subunit ClpC [candidate division WWE3 bacterium CG08_land_8_20_14_0_20_40_13]|uniref:ATP-dependent Clp protease ATP-binding subunit ClpC n=1 Tax=candidate division WWE3 bacterium CG08_land_8_20_14_0_20_40_13 TaxID=1975084 RepID=A0A2H0XE24_UNCKA|nr:MAG: ATP-dependent Clp protease ATP-binding subunit ClpC [candidate division WWE3 bacterium CG08_land_8_20_14_0_20_40_13]